MRELSKRQTQQTGFYRASLSAELHFRLCYSFVLSAPGVVDRGSVLHLQDILQHKDQLYTENHFVFSHRSEPIQQRGSNKKNKTKTKSNYSGSEVVLFPIYFFSLLPCVS